MSFCPKCNSMLKKGVCWECFVNDHKDVTYNISTNVGIPEKRRGWERADRQYHGSQFHSGEW